ncbi:protein phosphatase 2C-related protein [Planoprotostelium fungivorum]|uniref:Protein phosphatase 2C-related protein n=1 Tax=Planoprotostelium fungivorum TaxID=1890364 RepID=A0A2P6N025_9EUKA|nr:protein phosphatase 2C-related protein [Planoprotostelium fungivorum]
MKINTAYSADSIEFCPFNDQQDLFLCGTYQLIEETKEKVGRLYLYQLNQSYTEFHEVSTMDVPAILDLKWSYQENSQKKLSGMVDAAGRLTILQLESQNDSYRMSELCSTQVDDAEGALSLSLDWSDRVKKSATPRIIVSYTSANPAGPTMSVFSLTEGGLSQELQWKAHEYENWIAAFNYHQEEIVYSGGDDCKTTVPVAAQSISFSMGVTSIQSCPHRENLLAVGSYDDTLSLWDTRKMTTPTQRVNLGGGIWRVRWHPDTFGPLAVAAMRAGFHVLELKDEQLSVVSSYRPECEPIAYGIDWKRGDSGLLSTQPKSFESIFRKAAERGGLAVWVKGSLLILTQLAEISAGRPSGQHITRISNMSDKSSMMTPEEEEEMNNLMMARRSGRSAAFYGEMKPNPSRGVGMPVKPNPTPQVTESGLSDPKGEQPTSPRILRKSVRIKVGFASSQGRRPTMEDEVIIAGQLSGKTDTDYFAVFDGHGGRDAAIFASQNLHPLLAQNLENSHVSTEDSIKEAFQGVQRLMREKKIGGGCTAIVALLIGNTCYVANAGDSRAVFMQSNAVKRVSTDHKPDLPSEQDRIQQAGGTVTKIAVRGNNKTIARVNGVLAVSRALGDLGLEPFITAEPEIQTFQLSRCEETTLVLACDGLWDVLEDQEAMEMAQGCTDVKESAVKLVEAGISKMSMDNISVVVAKLPPQVRQQDEAQQRPSDPQRKR